MEFPVNIVAEVRMRWWLKLYLRLLSTFCALHGTEPDMDRLAGWIKCGVSVRLIAVPAGIAPDNRPALAPKE